MSRLRQLLFAMLAVCGPVAGLFSSSVWAGEADDLQRMIDGAKQGTNDLERLDELRTTREEITMLRLWLDISWRLRSEQKYDEVRVVLDRCQAQADMIRQMIAASKVVAKANEKEAEVKALRAEIAKTRQAIQAATLEKTALQARIK